MVTNKTNPTLKALNGLRIAALLLQIAYLFYAQITPTAIIIAILSLQAILLLVSLLRRGRPFESSHLLVFLLFDLLLFMGYILQTGGNSNPLISLSFLPLIIACLSLPKRWALSILLVAIGLYSYLLWSQPVHHHMDFNNHLVGMWGVYIISASLLYFVISKQVSERQTLDKKYSQLRAQRQRDEHLMSVGLANADMAHQLNTPLASLVLLGDNLQQAIQQQISDEVVKDYLQQDLTLLNQQLEICRRISNEHLSKWQQESLSVREINAENFVNSMIRDFQLIRPEILINTKSNISNLTINVTSGFKYALLNLLDNAAKASIANDKETVDVALEQSSNHLVIQIIDYGKGLPDELKALYGYRPNDKSETMGIGSLLITANLERAGATIDLIEGAAASSPFGTKAIVTLPLSERDLN